MTNRNAYKVPSYVVTFVYIKHKNFYFLKNYVKLAKEGIVNQSQSRNGEPQPLSQFVALCFQSTRSCVKPLGPLQRCLAGLLFSLPFFLCPSLLHDHKLSLCLSPGFILPPSLVPPAAHQYQRGESMFISVLDSDTRPPECLPCLTWARRSTLSADRQVAHCGC